VTTAHERADSIFFSAESADYLYQLYLWFFKRFYRGEATGRERFLLVDPAVLAELQTMFGPFIRREHQRYDPLLRAILGDTQFAYLESARMFALNTPVPLLPPGPFDVFCVGSSLKEISHWLIGSTLYWVGRRSSALDPYLRRLNSLGPTVARLDGPDFAFHSGAKDVADVVRAAHGRGVRVLLFHNEERQIRAGLSALGVSGSLYECVGMRPITLGAESRTGSANLRLR
jgi:hypothetical protein